MNSKIHNSALLAAAALLALGLAGCDSITSTNEDPYANLPAVNRVLDGKITGLGSRRSVTLGYDADPSHQKSFIAAAPYEANVGLAVVPFSFGSVPAGTQYDIKVIQNPFGKTCSVVSNGVGVISADTEVPDIEVACVDSVPRYDLIVNLPADPALFTGLTGARVQVRTEEEWIDVPVEPGQTQVVFDDVLMNAAGQPNPFTWTVTANTTENNTTSKCTVTNATANVTTNGNVSTPVVGNPATPTQSACRFTIGGNIGYSAPAGSTATAAISGLELELRNVKQGVVETLPVATCTPASATDTCPYQFAIASRSDVRSIYDVAVSKHPPGQFCVVSNGGSAFLYVASVTGNPNNVTNVNVRCRALPETANQLKGLFRLQSSSWTPNFATTAPVTVNWTPFDLTTHNYGSSNMIAFFPNGTFLYGTHAGTANNAVPANIQVEHGFYDYNPATQKIRFTMVTDTNPSTTYPAGFGPYPNPPPTAPGAFSSNSVLSTTPGLSAAPGPVVANGSNHSSLSNVSFGTVTTILGDVRTITGDFGSDGTAATNARLTWLLQEPVQVAGEMTGGWVSQDARRFWSWDKRSDYGIAAAVMGGAASMNDACFELTPNDGAEGFYVRRPSNDGCYPFSRPVPGTPFTFGVTEIADFSSPAMGISLGFIGRIPGGNPIATTDSRPPSPNYFRIGPANSYTFDDTLFTEPAEPFTTWCDTEILGIRPTQNGQPIDYPFYFCRSIAP